MVPMLMELMMVVEIRLCSSGLSDASLCGTGSVVSSSSDRPRLAKRRSSVSGNRGHVSTFNKGIGVTSQHSTK
jgi:hypothetical protein